MLQAAVVVCLLSRSLVPTIAPTASSLAAKLRSWIALDEAFSTDGKVVWCKVCNKNIGCSMKSQLQQHILSALHAKNKHLSSSKKQVLLTQMKPGCTDNDFFKDMCRSMIIANIPLSKLQVPAYRSFLEKYCGRAVPDESTLRKKYLDICYQETLQKIRDEVGDSYVYIAVDETTDAMGRYIANLIVGKLISENSSKPYLLACKVLERTNFATISRFVNEGLKFLWNDRVKEERVLVMYSDAAAYMKKAAVSLKVFYPNLIHFTCLAHGLQRVAEEIRGSFPQVNKLISSMKKVFVKAPLRVQTYREQLPGVALPPEPVLTRWGTWLQAVHFYSAHLQDVKTVIDSFPADSSVAVSDAQSILRDATVACDIAFIDCNFCWIADCIKQIEAVGMSLKESMDIVTKVKNNLKAVEGDVGVKVCNKFNAVLQKNPGYETFLKVHNILCGNEQDISEEISLKYVPLLKFAPVTSCDVERSFSLYKNILSDRRQNLTPEHLEKYLVVQCEK